MSSAEQLRACAARVDHACDTLCDPTPESLDVCSGVLQGALESLSALQAALCRGDAEALAEAWQLRRSIRRAGVLLSNAAEYHRGWHDRIGVRTAGYGPDGRAADSPLSSRVCLRA